MAKTKIGATLNRLFLICAGIAIAAFGILGRGVNGDKLVPWRRSLAIAGGLFFVYCGSMYYFPKGRQKRAELDRLLDEAERETGPHSK
jgi:hypothetical protein